MTFSALTFELCFVEVGRDPVLLQTAECPLIPDKSRERDRTNNKLAIDETLEQPPCPRNDRLR